MYIVIPITFNKCRNGLQTFECPAHEELSKQNLLHISARDPKDVLATSVPFSVAVEQYTEILKKMPQICAVCPHNRSK